MSDRRMSGSRPSSKPVFVVLFCWAQVRLAAETGRRTALYVSDAVRIQDQRTAGENELGIYGSPGEDTNPDAV